MSAKIKHGANQRVVSHVASYAVQIYELGDVGDEGNITHGANKDNNGVGGLVDSNAMPGH